MVIFIAWFTFIILKQKKKLELYQKAFENKDFCNVIIPSEDSKILEI